MKASGLATEQAQPVRVVKVRTGTGDNFAVNSGGPEGLMIASHPASPNRSKAKKERRRGGRIRRYLNVTSRGIDARSHI